MDIVKNWLDEMRSGKHPKGGGALCKGGHMCALGVLLYVIERDAPEMLGDNRILGSWDGLITVAIGGGDYLSATIPSEVFDRVGLRVPQSFIYEINDNGERSFEDVASELEAALCVES